MFFKALSTIITQKIVAIIIIYIIKDSFSNGDYNLSIGLHRTNSNKQTSTHSPYNTLSIYEYSFWVLLLQLFK